MRKLTILQRKLLATFLFSVFASVIGIIHGIFFDLDFAQIKRLSLGGFVLTFLLIFPTLLLLEWIFDLENHEEIKHMKERISKLERKRKK